MDTMTNTGTAESVNEQPSEVRQVQGEHEMRSMQKTSSVKTTQGSKPHMKERKPSDGIRDLKEQLAKARSSNESLAELLRKRQANQPVIRGNNDELYLEYSVTIDKQRYTAVQPLVKGEVVKHLAPLLAPLIKVANALLQGNDLRTLKEARTRDNDGKLTNQGLMLDEKQLYVTNPIDDLRYQWKIIAENPEFVKILNHIRNQKVFDKDTIDLKHCPGVTTGTSHSGYDTGEKVSSSVSETKEFFSPFFER